MIEIGRDVWIRDGIFINAGIKVGHGEISGMGAVFMKDVLDYAIVVGNPAPLIRMRFALDAVAAMHVKQCWNWPKEKRPAYGQLFNEPAALLN